MNGRYYQLVQLEIRQVLFNNRCTFYKNRRFEYLGPLINDLCASFAIITIAEMRGLARVVLNHYTMPVAYNYANRLRRKGYPVLLERNFLGDTNMQLGTLRFY